MSDIEFKSFSTTAHKYLLSCLRAEKLEHPETYEAVARVGEEMREYFMDFGQLNTLPPVPTLEKKEK